jgi:hypothetical protein
LFRLGCGQTASQPPQSRRERGPKSILGQCADLSVDGREVQRGQYLCVECCNHHKVWPIADLLKVMLVSNRGVEYITSLKQKYLVPSIERHRDTRGAAMHIGELDCVRMPVRRSLAPLRASHVHERHGEVVHDSPRAHEMRPGFPSGNVNFVSLRFARLARWSVASLILTTHSADAIERRKQHDTRAGVFLSPVVHGASRPHMLKP